MIWTLLWTDFFVYILIAMVLLFLVMVSKDDTLKHSFYQILVRPISVCSGLVLLAFVIVGLLDSAHFKIEKPESLHWLVQTDKQDSVAQKGEILSILDVILTPMRISEETTFSAPFAIYAYNKSNVINEAAQKTKDIASIRLDYPRLNINHHIKADEHFSVLTMQVLKGIGIGAGLSILIAFCYQYLVQPRIRILKKFPRKSAFLTVFIVMLIASIFLCCMSDFHVLGTSKVGGDVLYQCLKSIRTALVIGTLTTLIMLPFAIILGIMAGYFKGFWDDVISYLYTTLSAIPGVLLIAAAVMSLQVSIDNHPQWFPTMLERADIRLLCLCFILGITSWTGLCRILRGEALKLREVDYVQAAKALGVGRFTILFRHLLPNMMHIILISVALDFSGLVLAEAVLSYVGVGVDPASYSFGTLINSARLEMARAPVVWWSLLGAFVFMFILVLSANLFADALRDAFDPRSEKEAV